MIGDCGEERGIWWAGIEQWGQEKLMGEEDENTLCICMKLEGNNAKILHRVFLMEFHVKERVYISK